MQGASRHDGHNIDVEDTFADAVNHVLAREETLLEVFFQQHVIVFCRRLGESQLHLLVVAAILFGYGDFFGSRAREMVRLPRQGVGVSRHLLSVHDGNLDGGKQRLIFFAECRNRGGIVGIFLVHAVDKDNDGLLCLQTQRNRLLRADCHGTVRARYDDHCTAGSERFRDFAFKVVKTGNVDQVDLDVLPGNGSDGKRNGHLARNFLLVKVGDGGAVLDLAHALNDAAVKEHRFKQCGFAFTAVPDNGNIADILCRNTHIKTPYQKCICGKLFICNNC